MPPRRLFLQKKRPLTCQTPKTSAKLSQSGYNSWFGNALMVHCEGGSMKGTPNVCKGSTYYFQYVEPNGSFPSDVTPRKCSVAVLLLYNVLHCSRLMRREKTMAPKVLGHLVVRGGGKSWSFTCSPLHHWWHHRHKKFLEGLGAPVWTLLCKNTWNVPTRTIHRIKSCWS